MSSVQGIHITLAPELEQFVRSRVQSGRNYSPAEVVEEGIRLLERHEREHTGALAELKGKLKRGADQAERGELVDPDDVLARIERLKVSRRGTA